MSIDRTFFAFNEQRAEAKWTELGTFDLKTLAAADQKKNELEDALRKITDEQRNFEFLVDKFPWINDLLIEKS